jgi:hypothetical protein
MMNERAMSTAPWLSISVTNKQNVRLHQTYNIRGQIQHTLTGYSKPQHQHFCQYCTIAGRGSIVNLTTSATKALYTVGQHDAVVAGMGRKGKEEFNRRHERTYFHSAATSTEKGQEQGDNSS